MSLSKVKTLIAYGTRYGATASTAEAIGKILTEEGFIVDLANLKEEKVKDVSEYNLIVVGSGMAMGNWTSEAEDFVKKFQKEFENKKLALFVSSLQPIEDKESALNRIRKVGLEDKISKYHLNPIMTGLFGGILNYNKMNFFMRKSIEIGYKSALQKHGFKEVEPGVYDLHDWNEISVWAKEVAKKAKEP